MVTPNRTLESELNTDHLHLSRLRVNRIKAQVSGSNNLSIHTEHNQLTDVQIVGISESPQEVVAEFVSKGLD